MTAHDGVRADTPAQGLPSGCSRRVRCDIEIVNGPALLSKWVGETEAAIRDVFERAQKFAPSAMFFTETTPSLFRRTSDLTEAFQSTDEVGGDAQGINAVEVGITEVLISRHANSSGSLADAHPRPSPGELPASIVLPARRPDEIGRGLSRDPRRRTRTERCPPVLDHKHGGKHRCWTANMVKSISRYQKGLSSLVLIESERTVPGHTSTARCSQRDLAAEALASIRWSGWVCRAAIAHPSEMGLLGSFVRSQPSVFAPANV